VGFDLTCCRDDDAVGGVFGVVSGVCCVCGRVAWVSICFVDGVCFFFCLDCFHRIMKMEI